MEIPNFPDPTLLAIPLFLATVAWEWWAVKTQRARGTYQTSDALVSMAMGTGSAVSGILAGLFMISVSIIVWDYRVYTMPMNWWSYLACFIVYDFIYYWKHRFMHRMRWLWANHVVHHSSNFYNLTTALRQPWSGPISGLFVMPRWFEAVWNTPSHHRVHHGRNPRYLDTNYAGVWIIWDKMFGTFVPELDSDKPDYGLVTPLESRNPFWVAAHEYVELFKDFASDGLRPDRWIRRLYNPPGWSPTGDHNGSLEAKQAYLRDHPEQAGQPGLRLSKLVKNSGRNQDHAPIALRKESS